MPGIDIVEAEEDDIEDMPIFITGGEVIVRSDAASKTLIANRDSILIVLLNFDGMSFTFTLFLSLAKLLLLLLISSHYFRPPASSLVPLRPTFPMLATNTAFL